MAHAGASAARAPRRAAFSQHVSKAVQARVTRSSVELERRWEVFEGLEATLGEEHIDTLVARRALATAMAVAGDSSLDDAVDEFKETALLRSRW